MPKTPPPLLGFNNNVKHRGKIFHIQTEDSGVKRPHVITHLFADGGRIIKSSKLNYAEHVGRDDMKEVLRRMMKDQHKAMFVSLRGGEYDAAIEEALGPLPQPPRQPSNPQASPKPLNEPPPAELTLAVEQAVAKGGTVPPPADPEAGRYAAPRPPAIFDEKPSPESGSIFGGGIGEQSLDDVILSYIAEDLDTTPE